MCPLRPQSRESDASDHEDDAEEMFWSGIQQNNSDWRQSHSATIDAIRRDKMRAARRTANFSEDPDDWNEETFNIGPELGGEELSILKMCNGHSKYKPLKSTNNRKILFDYQLLVFLAEYLFCFNFI